MYKNLVYDLAHQESDSSVVRASNLYLEGHGLGSHWGLRKFFFWLFRLENASPLFIYFFNFVVTVSHNVYLGIFFKFILTLISSITSLSPPMSFQLIGRVKGSTMSVAMVSSYSLNCNITQKNGLQTSLEGHKQIYYITVKINHYDWPKEVQFIIILKTSNMYFRCYLWAGMSTLPPEIHRGNITKCIHLRKGTPASSGAKFGDVETFLWETWP